MPALTQGDVVEPMREMLVGYEGTPFAGYMPFTTYTEPQIRRIADLQPKVCATMHGSTFAGDGRQALLDAARALREAFGPEAR